MREIRPSGSVRGVRRKPYPYRDTLQPMRSMALFNDAAETGLREVGTELHCRTFRRCSRPPRRAVCGGYGGGAGLTLMAGPHSGGIGRKSPPLAPPLPSGTKSEPGFPVLG